MILDALPTGCQGHTHPPPHPSCDNLKCLQKLPNVPREGREANLSCRRAQAWVWPRGSCTGPTHGLPDWTQNEPHEVRAEVLTLTQLPQSPVPFPIDPALLPMAQLTWKSPGAVRGRWLSLWRVGSRSGEGAGCSCEPKPLSHSLAALQGQPKCRRGR